MTIEQLRAVHQAGPFRRFRLQLADGNAVDVPHPECLSYYRRGRAIAVAISDDVIKIIDLLLVASIEIGDGRPRSRREK